MDLGDGFCSFYMFLNLKMGICHCCDLWKMCDTKHLPVLSDHCHFFRDLLCSTPTDPCIDLIKDQCIDLIFICKDRFDGKHDPGKLTTGYDLSQRFSALTWICGNLIFHRIITIICIIFSAVKTDRKIHILKIQFLQSFDNLFIQLLTVFFPYL